VIGREFGLHHVNAKSSASRRAQEQQGGAVALDLSVKTAETHRANIMQRLGLHSVAELVRYAIRNEIIQA